MKKIIASIILLTSMNIALAEEQTFSAGRIEDGTPVQIFKKGGVATYVENYKTGLTTFKCKLSPKSSGQIVIATLIPGKNFGDFPFGKNSPAILMPGTTGKGTDDKTFEWKLTNSDDDAGNIKVFLTFDSTDEGATIQCQGTYTP